MSRILPSLFKPQTLNARILRRFDAFDRNLREDRAFIEATRNVTLLQTLDDQLEDLQITFDRLKGFVR